MCDLHEILAYSYNVVAKFMAGSKQLENRPTIKARHIIISSFSELLHSVTDPESIERRDYIDRHIDPCQKISKDKKRRLVIKNYTAG